MVGIHRRTYTQNTLAVAAAREGGKRAPSRVRPGVDDSMRIAVMCLGFAVCECVCVFGLCLFGMKSRVK